MANSVVDKINEFNTKFVQRFNKSIVTVKKTTNRAKKISTLYIIIPTTEQETKDIILNKVLSKDIKQQLITQSLIKEEKNIESCAFCGNLLDFTNYDELVYQYPRRLVDIRNKKEPEYRLYTKTREQQDKIRGFFNVCNNSKKSWFSVVEKCGNKFGLILKIVIPIK